MELVIGKFSGLLLFGTVDEQYYFTELLTIFAPWHFAKLLQIISLC
jgi:hypothetical protein